MTYEYTKKSSSISNSIIALMSVIFIGMIAWSVIVYNRTVETHYAIVETEKKILSLKQKNSELRNTLYTLTDFPHLVTVGESEGLVKARNLHYVTLPATSQELSLAGSQ